MGDEISLKVFFDDDVIYDRTWAEEEDWNMEIIYIHTLPGEHILKFYVPPSKDYEQGKTPWVGIDEVSLRA